MLEHCNRPSTSPGGANCVDENNTGYFSQRSRCQPISDVRAQTFLGRIRTCPCELTRLVASPRGSCHEQRNLLLHGDRTGNIILSRRRPRISPKLTKTLGRRVALHGTGCLITTLSSLILDFVILRWCLEALECMCQQLFGLPTSLPRSVVLVMANL